MISPKKAKKFVELRTEGDPDLHDITVKLLRGEMRLDALDVSPAATVMGEDIVAVLLMDSSAISEEWRTEIVKGCRHVGLTDAIQLLEKATEGEEITSESVSVLERLVRVLELAEPPELKNLARTLFPIATEIRGDYPDISYEIFSACRSYDIEECDISLWESLMEDPEFAAFAFNTLHEAGVENSRISAYLKGLWRHELEDDEGWDIDASYLTSKTDYNVKINVATFIRAEYPNKYKEVFEGLGLERDVLEKIDEVVEVGLIKSGYIEKMMNIKYEVNRKIKREAGRGVSNFGDDSLFFEGIAECLVIEEGVEKENIPKRISCNYELNEGVRIIEGNKYYLDNSMANRKKYDVNLKKIESGRNQQFVYSKRKGTLGGKISV